MNFENEYTISMDSSGFVNISDVVPDVILEVRYYSTYNFIGNRINGYEGPFALLTKEAAKALKNASDELIKSGYRLKIFDSYRPQRAVDHFVRWAEDINDTRMKKIFYPDVAKKDLFTLGFIAEHSGHSRGSTVDLTLFDMAKGCDADMGGYFDYFGEISHIDYEGITKEQSDNRRLLRETMVQNGFFPLEEEWWHFTLKDEPYPGTYFDFPVESL
jgi:D-alanyl-D-alanine dipeptidase